MSQRKLKSVKTPEQKEDSLLENCTKEQKEFITSPLTINSTLKACPGGGKTTSLVKKVGYHYYRDELKKDQFILTTFSKNARQELIEKGNNIIISKTQLFTNNNVMTTFSLAGRINSRIDNLQNNIEEIKDIDIDIENEDKILEAELQMEQAKFESGKKYSNDSNISTAIIKAILKLEKFDTRKNFPLLSNIKYIFVDEAQDLNENDYNFICMICIIFGIKCNLTGDPNQSIYQFRGGSSKYIREHVCNDKNNSKEFYLTTNFRSTQSIINLCNATRIFTDEPLMVCGRNEIGEKPKLFNTNKDECFEEILKFCKTSISVNTVTAIISPFKQLKNSPAWKFIDPLDLAHFLKKHGLPIKIFFNTDEEGEIKVSKGKAKNLLEKNKINILTFHGSKGQEYDNLCIINYHHGLQKMNPSNIKQQTVYNHLVHVAVSRAKNNLSIFCVASNTIHPSFKQIENYVEYIGEDEPDVGRVIEEDVYRSSEHLKYSITDIINDTGHKVVKDRDLLELENTLLENMKWMSYNNEDEIEDPSKILEYYDDISAVYGTAAENYLEYLYYQYNRISKYPRIYRSIYGMVTHYVIVPSNLKNDFESLCEYLNVEDNVISFSDLSEYYNELINRFPKLITFLYKHKINVDEDDCINVIVTKPTRWFEIPTVNKLLEEFRTKKEIGQIGFIDFLKLSLFKYQYDCENKDLWELELSVINKSQINKIETNILNLVRKRLETFTTEFEQKVSFTNLNLDGRCDLIYNNTLVELKFTHKINVKHKMQVTMYNMMLEHWCHKQEVWNLYTGEINTCDVDFDILAKIKEKVYYILLRSFTSSLYKTIWIFRMSDDNIKIQALEVNSGTKIEGYDTIKSYLDRCEEPRILVDNDYPYISRTKDFFKGKNFKSGFILISIKKLFRDFLGMDKKEEFNKYIDSLLPRDVSANISYLDKIKKIILTTEIDSKNYKKKLINVVINIRSEKEGE